MSLPDCVDDWVDEHNPVRVIDAFVDALDLAQLGFEGVRQSCHPSVLLKPYIDGSKFKAENNHDRHFTRAKVERHRAQLEESVARYLSQFETADRREPSKVLAEKTTRLKEKLAKLGDEMLRLTNLLFSTLTGARSAPIVPHREKAFSQ